MMESSVEAKSRQRFQLGVLNAKQPDYASERDDTLLSYMAGQHEDFALAEGACAEFYKRHYQFIVAFFRGRRWETEEQPVEEFVDVGFQKAWQYAGRFRCPSNLSAEQVRRKVRSWLLTISKRVFLDILREIPEEDIVPLDETMLGSDTDESVVPLSLIDQKREPDIPVVAPKRKTLVRKFLEETDRRTRAIVMAIGDHSKFPPEVTEAICKEFSIRKDCLGTYRMRAKEALKNYINQNE